MFAYISRRQAIIGDARTPVLVRCVAGGKTRVEERVPWWENYTGDPLCVYGHYSNYRGESGSAPRAICVDFAVAKRWQERKHPAFNGAFRGSLAALRLPEGRIVFDNGDIAHAMVQQSHLSNDVRSIKTN